MSEAAANHFHNLSEWKTQLALLRLPVDPEIKSQALHKLTSKTGNANNVARLVEADPAMTLLLFSDANKSLAISDNEAQSLSHSISLLGFPRVEQLIRRARSYSEEELPFLDQFKYQLSISKHAAHQAKAWARCNNYWPEDDIYYATLFHQAPLWALWYQAGEQMNELQSLRAQRLGANHSTQEEAVFGFALRPLLTGLCRQWYLPKFTQQSWQIGFAGSQRQWIKLSHFKPEQAHIELESLPRLSQVAHSIPFAVALANRLADETDWNWYSRQTLRLQKILASCLNQPLGKTIAVTHQQAASFSQQYPAQLSCPAEQLLGFYNKAKTVKSDSKNYVKPDVTPNTKSITEKSTKEKISTSASKPTTQNPALENASPQFAAIIQRINNSPSSFSNLHEVMNLVVSSICEYLDIERASISLLNLKTKQLRTYYSFGADDSPALQNFNHTLQRGDLFNKLMQKPVSLHLQSGNYAQIWPLLPGNFKQACGADEFFMMSIFSHKKPVALVYADCGNTNKQLNTEDYALFKQLCNALSRCLTELGA